MGWRFTSDAVHKSVLAAQEKMLEGIPSASRGTVFDYGQAAKLPIDEGGEVWREFKVTLLSYMVEDEDYWENVRLVGVATTNRGASGFAAPGEDRADEEGKPEPVGLVVLENHRLDIQAYSAEIYLRAFDDSDDLVKLMLKEFRSAAAVGLAGATAPIPFGGTAEKLGSAVLDHLVKKLGEPDEVGQMQHVLSEIPARTWKRKAQDRYWIGHKFAYFYNYDNGWEECYLVLFRFELMSEEMLRTGTEVPAGEERPEKPRDSKPDRKEEE